MTNTLTYYEHSYITFDYAAMLWSNDLAYYKHTLITILKSLMKFGPASYLQTLDYGEEFAFVKHSSLLQTYVNYNCKSFVKLGPAPYLQTLDYGKILLWSNTLAYYKHT